MSIPAGVTPEHLHLLFQYDPNTGQILRLRTMRPVGLQNKHAGQVTLEIDERRINARKVVIALMTGRWPNSHEYRFIGEDPKDLRWVNFLRIKDEHGNRRCNSCGQMKPPSNFAKSGRGSRSYCGHCYECHKENQYIYQRRTVLKRKYNISMEDYDRMLDAQGHKCALCGKGNYTEGKVLAVDHCHKTGDVRGLLCGPCNQAIGMLQDSPALILKAAKYVLDGGIT